MKQFTSLFLLLSLFLIACAPETSSPPLPTLASVASEASATPAPPEETATAVPTDAGRLIPPTFTPSAELGVDSVPDFDSANFTEGQAIYDQAQIALAETTTYRFEEITIVEWRSLWIRETREQNCLVQHPDIAYCSVSYRLQYNDEPTPSFVSEFVQIGDQFWIKEEHDVLWQELSPDELEENGLSEDGLLDLVITDYTHEVTSFRRGILDNVAAYEVILELDVSGYLQDILTEDFDESAVIPIGEKSIGRWWIGVEDGLVHKLHLDATYQVEDIEIDVLIKGRYFDFNQPIELPSEFDDKIDRNEQNT